MFGYSKSQNDQRRLSRGSFDCCLWLWVIMNVPIFWQRYITWELIVSWLSQYHISIYYQG